MLLNDARHDVITFAIVSQDPRGLLKNEKFLSDERRKELRKFFNVTPWSFAAGIYGTNHQVKASKRLIRKRLSPYGRIMFFSD